MNVIVDGVLTPIALSSCDQLGWLSGAGVFETIRTVDGKPWALSRHMRRAVTSGRKLGIRIPSEAQVRESIELLCTTHGFAVGMLRISFGKDGRWAAVHLPYKGFKSAAIVLSYPNKTTDTFHNKSYPYTHRLEILDWARSKGADEAIVFNDEEKVSEGSVTNLLFRISGSWVTPPLGDGALPGVMRALVIEYCGVAVRSIDREELPLIEAAFLLSSLRLAQPVLSIDGRSLDQSADFREQIEAMALRTSIG